MSTNTLQGKVALVTGAGQGLGRTEALKLGREGCHVVVNDVGRTPDGDPAGDAVVAEILGLGGSAESNYDDISTWAGAERLVVQALEVSGRLDVLVCNAGILRDRTIVNLTELEWDAVIAVHLKGHAGPLHFAAAHWRDRVRSTGNPVHAAVVTTSSEAGLYGNYGQANYSAAKAGIVALTQVAARELGQYGVTANVVCPRARTAMTLGVVPDMDPALGEADEWDPESVAAMVAFLAGPHARGITGQVFAVHGPTVSRLREWTPVDEIAGGNAAVRLADIVARREELGSPKDCVLVDFAEAMHRSGSLARASEA